MSSEAPTSASSQMPSAGPDSVCLLRRRVAGARILREHLVWEALRLMPSLGRLRQDTAAFARFRNLMDRDDLDGAIMLLSAISSPKLELAEAKLVCGIWTCRFAEAGKPGRRPRIHTAHHCHRPAALMLALLHADPTPASTDPQFAFDIRNSKDT